MVLRRMIRFLFLLILVWQGTVLSRQAPLPDSSRILEIFHSISSHDLLGYVDTLSSDRFGGRLTGTPGYRAAASWVAEHLRNWRIQPLGDDGTYFQNFPIPYTLVFPGYELYLHLPQKTGEIKKYYHFDDEFIPGSTSGSGEITAEVVYVGYGITAPELNYDDYADVDVRGKIVMLEREVPVSPGDDPETFKKWRPYSFHQYKLKNAVKHGAGGMLYNYGPIGNPNNAYDPNFIYSHVGRMVVNDIFTGTGKDHKQLVEQIKKELKPHSFATGKTVTMKNITEHHPEGVGSNVIGILPGDDPRFRDQAILIGAHLDHLGRCPEIMPGANDNASGVAVLLGLAHALARASVPFNHSLIFICFGAEEQAVVGSQYYLNHPPLPIEKTICFLNLDGVGCGDKIRAIAGKNFPDLWHFVNNANLHYVHRMVRPTQFANIARPRLDAARFLWAGIPTISFSAFGRRSFYHNTRDTIDSITPEILEDLARILFMAVIDLAVQKQVSFR